MGIFQSRPEEPTEWAGLPAEEWEPRVPGEVLPPAAPPVDVLAFLSGGVGVAVDTPAPETASGDTAPAESDSD